MRNERKTFYGRVEYADRKSIIVDIGKYTFTKRGFDAASKKMHLMFPDAESWQVGCPNYMARQYGMEDFVDI